MSIPAMKKMAALFKSGKKSEEARLSSPDERRNQPRFTTQFRSTFSGGLHEGNGRTLDLSVGGCKIESGMAVDLGDKFECRLHIPDLDWPIMIDEAIVRWVDASTFGLAFTRIRSGEQDKIAAIISKIEQDQQA
ncbi:MAG: PilZ domain-containing protein [Nitrospira sp.]|nr:PilZ domain-containing protein [Nitrospira sp.]